MKITVDLNVLLDVAQNRAPHYHASEEILHRARCGEYEAVLPGHAITTLHYILEKWSSTQLANQTIDGLLADFFIHSSDKTNFQRARQLQLKDFEDSGRRHRCGSNRQRLHRHPQRAGFCGLTRPP
jgi:hypothetical protein